VANYKLILKNTTGTAIELDEGIIIPASGQVTIDPTSRRKFWDDIDLVGNLATQIRNGDIIVNDGVDDLILSNGFSVERAIDYLKFPDRAFNLRFEAEPERSNGFVSKNVQEAIEEAKVNSSGVKGRTFLKTFFNNGNTANKWLFSIPTSEATDQLPYHAPFDLEVFGILFSNKNSNIDCDVEFYINGLTNPFKVYTMEVRDSRFYHVTVTGSLFSQMLDDNISIFIKKIGNSTPSSVEIGIHYRISTNNVGSGGDN
jgi:hypothetical protein